MPEPPSPKKHRPRPPAAASHWRGDLALPNPRQRARHSKWIQPPRCGDATMRRGSMGTTAACDPPPPQVAWVLEKPAESGCSSLCRRLYVKRHSQPAEGPPDPSSAIALRSWLAGFPFVSPIARHRLARGSPQASGLPKAPPRARTSQRWPDHPAPRTSPPAPPSRPYRGVFAESASLGRKRAKQSPRRLNSGGFASSPSSRPQEQEAEIRGRRDSPHQAACAAFWPARRP